MKSIFQHYYIGFLVLLLSGCASGFHSITNVATIVPSTELEVTGINYTPDTTFIDFRTTGASSSEFTFGSDVLLVDDNGIEHTLICTKGIETNVKYNLEGTAPLQFTACFTTVNASNKALDMKQNGRFTILGIHESGRLNVPETKNSGFVSKAFDGKSVNVDIVLHGYDGDGEDVKIFVQYTPPTGYHADPHNQAEMDSDRHFRTNFVMYNPERLLVYTMGARQQNARIFMSPGDSIHIDMYEDGRSEWSGASIVLDKMPEDLPQIGKSLSKYNDNLSYVTEDNLPFRSIGYSEQKSELEELYAKELEQIAYIVWRFKFSPLQAALATMSVHDKFCGELYSTQLHAIEMYETYAKSDEERAIYAPSLEPGSYRYLSHVPQNEKAYILKFMTIPGQVSCIGIFEKCLEQIPDDDEHWCRTAIEKQLDMLHQMSGWDKNSFMTQLTLVELVERMSGLHRDKFQTSGEDLHQWLKQELSDPYCISAMEGVYKDWEQKRR